MLLNCDSVKARLPPHIYRIASPWTLWSAILNRRIATRGQDWPAYKPQSHHSKISCDFLDRGYPRNSHEFKVTRVKIVTSHPLRCEPEQKVAVSISVRDSMLIAELLVRDGIAIFGCFCFCPRQSKRIDCSIGQFKLTTFTM